MREYTLTKREKFINIWNELNSFIKNDYSNCSVEELKGFLFNNDVYLELKNLFYQHSLDTENPRKANDEKYQYAIKRGLKLIKEVLNKYFDTPILCKDGIKYDTVEDYISKFDIILAAKESSSFDEGGFHTNINGYKIVKYSSLDIKRISGYFSEYSLNNGYILENINEFEPGIYTIGEGYRFDIIIKDNYKTVRINTSDVKDHPIFYFLKKG